MGANSGSVENFVRVGDPTIVDGIMTPNSTGWIKTPDVFDPDGKSWEIQFVLTPKGNGYQNYLTHNAILIQTDGYGARPIFRVKYGTSENWQILLRDIITTENVKTIFRIGWNGNAYYANTSTDNGATWVELSSSNTNPLNNKGAILFGAKANVTGPVYAVYDLTQMYAKIDGTIVWTPYK